MTSEKHAPVTSSLSFGGLVTAVSGVIVICSQSYFPAGDPANSIIMVLNPVISGGIGHALFGLLHKFNFRTVAEMQEDRNFERNLAVMKSTYELISDPQKKQEALAAIDDLCLARTRNKIARSTPPN